MSGGLRPHPLVDTPCPHDFVFVGIRYEVGDRLPGSSAREITYFESYRCRHCLTVDNFRLRESHDSFQPIRFGATPKP